MRNVGNQIPTSDAGELALEIDVTEKCGSSSGEITIRGNILLNQCGTLFSRKKHQLKGSSRHNDFLQRIYSTLRGTTIPLMNPEAMIFYSIHWK